MRLRRAIAGFTLVCFVTTQTASLAGPHDEATARRLQNALKGLLRK